MSFEKKVLGLSTLYDEVTRKMPRIEGKTFRNEDVYIDFAQYVKCKFENCNIIIGYGIFRLVENTFTGCKFITKSGSPAETILKLDRALREPSDLEKSNSHKNKKHGSLESPNSEVPPGKYSRWCERRPLACDNEEKYSKASKYLRRKDLTDIEKSVMFTHELAGCQGIEFVVLSSAKFKNKVELHGNIILVPCFIPEIEGKSWNEPLVRLSSLMMKRAKFVYDGWKPINNWNIESVRESIRMIDQILSLFSIQERISITWEPKYMPRQYYPSSQNIKYQHIQEVEKLSSFVESWNHNDSTAFYRSLAWLSQSLTLPLSASRFLSCVVVIESLANYIENKATDDSIFLSVRSTETFEKEESEKCIEETLDRMYDSNKIEAIRSSFYDCVHLSTTRMLKNHLKNIFREDKESIELLFETKIEGKTLYDLRHMIAHGGIDALSDLQRQKIRDRIWHVENIARQYLVNVLEIVTGRTPFAEKMVKSMVVPFQVGAKEEQYRGPIHMAEIYV